ncbi:MAG: GTPase ObgE [Proteobacteria bacterium]|nr:GTPase ObgE [Pseudomonadota bacterium]
MAKTAFIDEVEINVAGGDGGNGIVSFLRERARPFGGPNGGNGGRGGRVVMTATTGLNTLLEFRFKRNIRAANGKRGGSSLCHGAHGEDVVLPVPLGTRVVDAASGYLHADLVAIGDSVVLADGGRGGFGNAHYKSSTNRTPRTASKGEEGVQRCFRLELKVVADVGLLGLPNAGKSTFLRAISAARPKVAAYPFTTLAPSLGWVELEYGGEALVVADIPGIIRGAADGAGLGNRFLRHLSRTALLCQIVDATSETAIEDCRDIDSELRRAAEHDLADKPRWLLLNKIDLLTEEEQQEKLQQMQQEFPFFERVLALSALAGNGVRDCVKLLLARQQAQQEQQVAVE